MEKVLQLVLELASRDELKLERHHVARGHGRLDELHGLLAAQPCDELVEDEQRRERWCQKAFECDQNGISTTAHSLCTREEQAKVPSGAS